MSPSGKAPDFDSGIRRFKSCYPSHPCGITFKNMILKLSNGFSFKEYRMRVKMLRYKAGTRNSNVSEEGHIRNMQRWTRGQCHCSPRTGSQVRILHVALCSISVRGKHVCLPSRKHEFESRILLHRLVYKTRRLR